MLPAEQFPFFIDDFSCQELEVLLDLFTGFVQQGVPLLDLLLHGVACGLQRGIFRVEFPAFPGKLVSFEA